jgi:peptidylprolyl isomerase
MGRITVNISRYLLLVLGLAVLTACTPSNSAPAANAIPTAAQVTVVSGQSPCIGVNDPQVSVAPAGNKQWAKPEMVIDANKSYCAILTTDKGRIVAELYPKAAPQNVNSFVFLAQQGFYEGLTWHRVLAGFVAQTGDPTGTGGGGPGYRTPLEVNPSLKYDREGVIGVARTQDPNSAGSQFFITFAPLPSLDPGGIPGSAGYTIIGQVVEGLNVAKAIRLRDPQDNPNYVGDPLISVRIVEVPAP